MKLAPSWRAAGSIAALTAVATVAAPSARAGERDQLNACKAMVDGSARLQGAPAPDAAALQRCRQIIKEWTLRDSRMNVDEDGRPLR